MEPSPTTQEFFSWVRSNRHHRQSPATLRVLIVEDDHATARSLSGILDDAGYRTTVCRDGTAAMQCASDGLDPAAAIIDIHLPDLSGLVLTQKLRERLGAGVPIIVVSGDTSMETLNSLAHVGATYFLSKPMTAPVVLERLGECLRASAARRAS